MHIDLPCAVQILFLPLLLWKLLQKDSLQETLQLLVLLVVGLFDRYQDWTIQFVGTIST